MSAARVSEEEARRLFKRAGAPFPEPEPEPEDEPDGEIPTEPDHWKQIDDFLAGPDETPTEPAIPEPPEPPRVPTPFRPPAKRERTAITHRAGLFGLETSGNAVRSLADRIASAPTPGGLFPWAAILFVFLFALVPVNGSETRLSLIWRVLTNGAYVPLDQRAVAINVEWSNAAFKATEQSAANLANLEAAATAGWEGFWTVAQSALGSAGSAGELGADVTSAPGEPLAYMGGPWLEMAG